MDEREWMNFVRQKYYEGIREGLKKYAWWKDGEQFVGTCGITLKQALATVDKEEATPRNMHRFKPDI